MPNMHTAMAFDQGKKPTIAVINRATLGLGVPIEDLVIAMQAYVNDFFGPVWDCACTIQNIQEPEVPAGMWAVVFTDTSDDAADLGYHDLTPDGFPLSHVFVKTTLDAGEKVSVTTAHELAEMLVDPDAADGTFNDADGLWYAKEICDAVQASTFQVNGIDMASFVYPSWFESFRRPGTPAGAVRFDHMGECKKPFDIRPGGYMPVFDSGGWKQVFGNAAARKAFQKGPIRDRHLLRGRKKKKSKIKPIKTSKIPTHAKE